jgi:ATP-binding cassette subfamily F protein 3
MGVFEQTNTSTLVDTRRVVEEILYSAPDVDNQKVRNICGAMMFTGDDALKKIQVLSGGEKSRVMLGKLLVTPVNMLLLDEPTNHLDMESSDALLAAIDSFEGAVVIVTHNEMFLHALAERLIVFDNNSIDIFEGSYQRFLEKGGWQDEDDWQCSASSEDAEVRIDHKLTKKDIRRRRSEIITERGKILRPFENRIEQIEDEIDSLEKDFAQYTQKMQEASENKEGAKVTELARSIHTCQSAIGSLFDELDKLTKQAEKKRVFFEEQLNQVEQLD